MTDNGLKSGSSLIRVKEVLTLLLDDQEYLQSKRNSELVKLVCEKLGIEERTAYRYIAEAKKEINALYSKNIDKKIKKALRDREQIIRELKGGTDKRTLLAALKDRDELLGLYEQKINHNVDTTERIVFVESLRE